jgi:hypothetical protein
MDAKDRLQFAESLIAMGELYDRDVSTSLAEMYFADLAEFPLSDVLVAFRAHKKDPERGRFFPKVADLMDKLRVSHEEAALVAWADVRLQLRNCQQARTDDPITQRAIDDLGGWYTLGRKTVDQLTWTEKEFVKRYAMYSERGTDLKQLSGPRNGLRLVGRDE